MKYVAITFSPTGGTKKAADAVTRNWPSVESVDLTDTGTDFGKCRLHAGDLALIAMPSYGGLAPKPALERLAKIRGNGAGCILVCVYGNRAYEDTLVQMEDTAKKCGFQVVAAISAVAEHSIMHQYASGRPDTNDQAQLAGFGEKILDKWQKGDKGKPSIPGNRPYKKSGGPGLVPKAGKSCTACGLCAKQCPVQAISHQNPKSTDSKKCISCMRCVSLCPQKARSVNKMMVSAAAMTIKKACSVSKQNELFI